MFHVKDRMVGKEQLTEQRICYFFLYDHWSYKDNPVEISTELG